MLAAPALRVGCSTSCHDPSANSVHMARYEQKNAATIVSPSTRTSHCGSTTWWFGSLRLYVTVGFGAAGSRGLRGVAIELTLACRCSCKLELGGRQMSQWVRLCATSEVPAAGSVGEYSASGVDLCLANSDGKLSALANLCPHRSGPLGQGWIEDGKVLCPWHAWAFDCQTGECPEENSKVNVFPLRLEGEDVLVEID